jgi:hypothetical protein
VRDGWVVLGRVYIRSGEEGGLGGVGEEGGVGRGASEVELEEKWVELGKWMEFMEEWVGGVSHCLMCSLAGTCVAFNGGKDCTVILALLQAILTR